ncbi:hypothetical protein LRAMOSA01402 [Lichtheimia ramosa]|uniref:Endonuclease III homolog n=1 Tax=Lichtheimia ramosa TaxID=688394 RepID=A0A077WK28_9FUNG|nr:hypothetical protein LRAMOSA01402 [Lichtheimia ramosa]
MSFRRSARIAKTKGVDALAESLTVKSATKRKQSPSITEKKTTVKRRSKSVKQEAGTMGKAPENWQTVYDRIRDYRSKTTAPVDTMGCERLAEENVSDKVFRFQTLISLMLSSQTKDTVTSATVRNMQATLPGGLTLESILQVDEADLDQKIKAVGFHQRKASYIKKTAIILRDKYDGDIPDTIEGLMDLPGVGPKMGYLALQIAWKMNAGIGVDVHVHRISNRLGWCSTENAQPEDTRKQLESWLPKEYWRPINPLLVGFGQVMCLPRGPKCGECPVREYCPSAITSVKKVKKEVVRQDSVAIKEETVEDVTFTGEHDPAIKTENPLDW